MKRKRRRWVIKAGSNMVCSGGPLLARAWMQQLARLKDQHGIEVIWVTSGAIASATERTKFKNSKRRTLSEKQALSAIGQPLVMDLYNLALQTSGMLGAQVLLTYDDLANKQRRANFANTLEQLLKWDVTPILNENDAVATEEIKFGDNDSLSAKVAGVMRAERLVILTDVEGLCDSDPRKNKNARLVHTLDRISKKLLAQTGTSAGSSRGTGGMYSKLSAAGEASRNGIEAWLVKGDLPDVLTRVAGNETVGTRIRAR
ncbi:MAG: glutamate 5-kinase [Deltaproteobacteria bacterium]|nr:glutamate 5-kinase [Deltaproteobacteria bacterium]